MSDLTAGFALDSMLATNEDDEDFGYEMLALLEAVDFEFERWCRVMDLDPDEPASLTQYENVFYSYPKVWTELGQDDFIKAIKEKVERWVRLLSSKVRSYHG